MNAKLIKKTHRNPLTGEVVGLIRAIKRPLKAKRINYLDRDFKVYANGTIKRVAFKDAGGRNRPERKITPTPDKEGYLVFCFMSGGKACQGRVHRLVALLFLGSQPGQRIEHKDGDRSNNHVSNLRIKD